LHLQDVKRFIQAFSGVYVSQLDSTKKQYHCQVYLKLVTVRNVCVQIEYRYSIIKG